MCHNGWPHVCGSIQIYHSLLRACLPFKRAPEIKTEQIISPVHCYNAKRSQQGTTIASKRLGRQRLHAGTLYHGDSSPAILPDNKELFSRHIEAK